jgi:hypothetical protein
MARYALRNQKKIAESLGENFLKWLLKSLDQHFANHPEINYESGYTNQPYPVIHVKNAQPKTDSIFELYVTKVVFDVYNLAYKSCMG